MDHNKRIFDNKLAASLLKLTLADLASEDFSIYFAPIG